MLATPAIADEFKHEAKVIGKMGNHPNVAIFFEGDNEVDVLFKTDARSNNNPAYQQNEMQGENPLHEGAADPGTPNAMQSITFELSTDGLPAINLGEGIVHRDIAARNLLVQANGGTYASEPDAFLLFSHDGPTDLRSNVGPVRWMAPESLRLQRTGSTDPDDYIEIQAGSYFDATYVPEPATLAIFGLGGLIVARRRR